jgi:uncharacterized protein YdiU (UPF0061 family)
MAITDKTVLQPFIREMVPCAAMFKISISHKKNMQNFSPGVRLVKPR